MKHCSQCNIEFPDHFQICGSCGRALTNTNDRDSASPEASLTPGNSPRIAIMLSPVAETRALTEPVRASHPASEARSAPTLTILSSYSEPETPPQFRWSHGLIFGFVLLLFVSVLGIGGWYLWSQRRSVTQTSQTSNFNPDVHGIHELDLTTTPSGRALALAAVPNLELESGVGDFLIIDITDPAEPILISEWGVHTKPTSHKPHKRIFSDRLYLCGDLS